MKRKITYFMANLFVFVSPFFSWETAMDKEDLETIALGFPFGFIHQDQTRYDPPYPFEMTLQAPWENPTSINWLLLLASLLIVNGLVYLFFLWRR